MRLVRDGPTDSIDTASTGFETRQDAAVILAALFHVAIAIAFAFVLLATNGWISGKAIRAETNRTMVRDATFRASTARAYLTRISTLSVNASLLDGAIGIGLASWRAATNAT